MNIYSKKLNFADDLKILLEQRQGICKLIHAHPQFGSDYTNRFIWNDKDHPYKNLANYLIWCEYLIKTIRTSNELEHRRQNFNSAKILAMNKDLSDEIGEAYKSAIIIKEVIIFNSEININWGMPQYTLELAIFREIDCNLNVLRPRLQIMQEVIQDMYPVIEKNEIIMNDFRDCFVNCKLSIELLKENLKVLVDQYGQDNLNNYAKHAWYFYDSFNIKAIIEETEILLSNIFKDDNNLGLLQNFLISIDNHFFIEYKDHLNAYMQVKQILNNILNRHVTNWDSEFREQIAQLYTFKLLKFRIGLDVLEEVHMDAYRAYKENQTKSEQLRTRGCTGDLLWRLATRGFLFNEYLIQKIELSVENSWQLYHYAVMSTLNRFIIYYEQNLNYSYKKTVRLINSIKNYIFNGNLYNLYEIVLLFIGDNLINRTGDNNLMKEIEKIKEIIILSLQYNNFKLIN